MKKRSNPGRPKSRCHKPKSRAWASFKKKHTKPGMGKAAYRKAVAKHWKPLSKRTAKKCAPKRRVKRRSTRARRTR
jgi:LPS sulfotransferase NodH